MKNLIEITPQFKMPGGIYELNCKISLYKTKELYIAMIHVKCGVFFLRSQDNDFSVMENASV